MSDPSLLVTRPTAGDPTLAPAGRDLLYILAPAPNTAVGTVDWEEHRQRLHRQHDDRRRRPAAAARRRRRGAARRRPRGLGPSGHGGGHAVRAGHTFGQTGPFRPANTVRGIDNVVLAGSSTVPGVGVPTALLSGRLAADRITGASTRASGDVIGSGEA